MSNGTVELTHTNFLSKMNIIREALQCLNNNLNFSKINLITERRFELIQNVFKEIDETYEMDVISVLTEYYDSNDNQNSTVDEYNIQVTGGNYCSKLQQCYDFIDGIYKYLNEQSAYCHITAEIETYLQKYNSSTIQTRLKDIHYDTCVCGVKMKIHSESSKLICEECGRVVVLYGTVFEDTQFYNQEGQRSKHGCYDPSRHCKFWVLRIQAKENADIPKKCLDSVLYCIKRDNITDRRKLMCTQIRLYLKETKNTEYNDHIPLIRKILTGVVPPQLVRKELIRLYNLFDKAVTAFETIKPKGKSNTMYYPYIIYKILDLIIENSTRKRRILECIHLQSRDTLIVNDNLWESICNELPDLTYKPTDRNDQKIDN